MVFAATAAAFAVACGFVFQTFVYARRSEWRWCTCSGALACVFAVLAGIGTRLLFEYPAVLWTWFPLPCSPQMGAPC
jgi:hypothetical protein